MEHSLQRTTSRNLYGQGIAGIVFFTAVLLAASVATASVAHAEVASTTVSGVVASTTDTTALITWTTNEPATGQIRYGTSTSYTATSTLQTIPALSHSQMLSGLMPDTLYHFAILSSIASGTATTSLDRMFVTRHAQVMSTSSSTSTSSATSTTGMASTTSATSTMGMGSTTASSTATTSPTLAEMQSEIVLLWNRIHVLENLIAQLQLWIQMWMPAHGHTETSPGMGNGSGTNLSTSTPTTAAMGTIDQNGSIGRVGGAIDFGGRHFGHEEAVLVTLGGTTIASAHADGGGNFSTGSLRLPMSAGTYSYSFRGQTSGIMSTATVTVQN